MRILPVLLVCLFLSGCATTTAGPFVTNISSDGKGNLIIEKGSVELDPFMGTVTNKDLTTTHIQVVPNREGK